MLKECLVIGLFSTVSLNFASAATLNITLKNLTPNQGCINLAIYSNAQAYSNDTTQQATYMVKQQVFANTVNVIIPGLPAATYAVKVFQDNDCLGKMQTNLFGVPKNKYGFSNGTRSTNFDKAAFVIADKSATQVITLE